MFVNAGALASSAERVLGGIRSPQRMANQSNQFRHPLCGCMSFPVGIVRAVYIESSKP